MIEMEAQELKQQQQEGGERRNISGDGEGKISEEGRREGSSKEKKSARRKASLNSEYIRL
jgi:hypothetical protein